MHATCPPHLNFLGVTTLILFSESTNHEATLHANKHPFVKHLHSAFFPEDEGPYFYTVSLSLCTFTSYEGCW